MILHAGLVAIRHREFWRGLLITGASGSGKSDLALRLIDAGFSLVADDRVIVWTSAGRLYGRAPDSLCGKVEARGFGLLEVTAEGFAPIDLVCDLSAENEIERMPPPQTQTLAAIDVPLVRLAPFEASSPAKLRRWLIALG